MPSNVAPIGAALTPGMVAHCNAKANNFAIPIGDVERTVTDGVRVVYVTSCHDRHAGETQASGAYHGCSVWLDSSPVTSGPTETDWPIVAAAGAAIAAVAAGFYAVIRR